MTSQETVPYWKTQELGHVKAELLEIRDVDERLYERALRAYEKYGIPAPLVTYCARRAWAQGTPHLFAVFLMNHLADSYKQLPDLVLKSMVL